MKNEDIIYINIPLKKDEYPEIYEYMKDKPRKFITIEALKHFVASQPKTSPSVSTNIKSDIKNPDDPPTSDFLSMIKK